MNLVLDLSILSLISIIAIYIVSSSSLLHTVIFSSVFSLLCALVYLLMAAPDVALTEASIGACVTTCFLLASLKYLDGKMLATKVDFFALSLCVVLCGLLCYGVMDFHVYRRLWDIYCQEITGNRNFS
ncbi:MAG: DUF4040 domain-containing protein [Alphaproteobacteria bacterium]|nr:DUF4040 domain-containing protein [Alphaproteobacteria bacterium]